MVIASTLALIGVLVGWNMNANHVAVPSTTVIPEIPERLQNAGQNDNIVQAIPAPKAEIKPSDVPYGPYLSDKIPTVASGAIAEGIRVHVIENSWVEIRNAKGKTLVSRVLKKGEKYLIPKKKGLTITIGNAGGVRLSIDGKSLAPVGERGQVVRNLSLDAAYLSEKLAP